LRIELSKKGAYMATSIQSVIKNISEVILKVPQKISLHVALMIMTSERKNYTSMARSNGLTYEQVYIANDHVNDYIDESVTFLHSLIKKVATKEKPGYLIADFTVLKKQFSEHIPSVTYDYDGADGRVSKGFSAGFVFWSKALS
jgi:hypothetical protein